MFISIIRLFKRFNSRTREGATDLLANHTSGYSFNSRTREGATEKMAHSNGSYGVSIHAPVKVRLCLFPTFYRLL